MASAEVVIPRKIGACAATRAVVLLYTVAGGTKIRKRIMPIEPSVGSERPHAHGAWSERTAATWQAFQSIRSKNSLTG